ncbi:hypothetical protein TNIN_159721 [Trichonephila inaurata madagascariensis]|uniref:Uncharacterized protein n=1 Tax=Trichonephila inaurata madagascariensis TaxID=2747483 RepID=A0A8X6Y1E0_9ARAC|nr:hypothetical protein TNIN_159721 [Trichonephila inaurata madagascariensis]
MFTTNDLLCSNKNAQDSDQELTYLISLNNYNLKFNKLPVIGSEYMIFCEVSTDQPRPHIPAAFRREIFERYHRTFLILVFEALSS